MPRDLQLVLKVAERCNINCTYCYYFNAGNDAPLSRPKVMSERVARSVVDFVERCSEEVELGNIRLILHGGEPLLVPKQQFRRLCEIFSELKSRWPSTNIVTTTNGILIDDEWIDIFAEFDIGVCVSIDGPQEYHDRERLDFKGRGTYASVLNGIEQLTNAAALGRVQMPGAIAVIDPRNDGAVVYHHLVRELGFRILDLAIPMTCHDSNPRRKDIERVGTFLVDSFNEWVKDDDPQIFIKIFHKYFARVVGNEAEEDQDPSGVVAGIGSDGTIVNDDSMQILGPEIFDRGLNVSHSTLSEYLAELNKGEVAGVHKPYVECLECKWYKVCRPASLPWLDGEMRYKKSNGFQNKLVHCDALQLLYSEMKAYVWDSTIPEFRSFAPNTTEREPKRLPV